MIHHLWHQYPDVYTQLEATQRLLIARTQIRDPQINDLVQGQITAGGKMLRSGLMFMLARFHNADNRQLVNAAAAIEALHLATLIHDDVLDQSTERRGQVTVQTASSNQTAIYAGDFLFSVYFDLLAEAAPSVANVGTNARSMRRIFLGELDQNGTMHGLDLTVHQYLHQISGKTAALFSLASHQGMLLAGGTRQETTAATQFGRFVGMAFQMIDDLLDYLGTPATMQKPHLEDLKNGILTLPAIYALQTHRDVLVPLIEAGRTDNAARQHAAQLIIETGVPKARLLATQYTDKALAALASLPAGSARADLTQLTQLLLKRNQ